MLILIFSIILSSTSWGKWIEVAKTKEGYLWYVDNERISKRGAYVYAWDMINYGELDKYGSMSSMTYKKIDCEDFRFKNLRFISFTQQMGKGSTNADFQPPEEWIYTTPNSINELIVKEVCNYIN